jgi:hypothetical protein
MSDQAPEQSPVEAEASIEERLLNYLNPEVAEEAAPQDTGEEAPEAEEVDTQETEPVEAEAEEAEPDLVEIEVDGEKYQVPESLKSHIMLQADYTRKTQEVAEQRKGLEQGWQQLQQAAELQQAALAEYAQLSNLDSQLQSFQAVDWNSLYDRDPAEFVRLKEARRDLLDQRQNLTVNIQSKQQEQYQQQQQARSKAIEEGVKVLTREIPSWNNDLAKTLNQFATEKLGFTPDEVNTVIDPRMVKLLHKAYLYDKSQSNKPLTDKRVSNLPKVSKPGGPKTQTVNQSREQEARKLLKKTGDPEAYFLAKYSK